MQRAAHRLLTLPALLLTLAASACNWVSLAKNALSYRETQRGEAANLAALGPILYASQAQDGFAIVDARSGRTVSFEPAPAGSESADDLAVAGGLLFVLDARAPGHLSVYSLDDPLRPRLVSIPHEVPVGPFSGVSAADGVCIVSGGTSALTVWRYDSAGVLAGPSATTDLGRGQPDVLVAAGGRLAYVPTHYWGPYFGLDVVRIDLAADRIETLSELELDGAGFTEGGSKPANFPVEAAALGRDTVLVAFARGLAVIGTASPERPVLLASVDVGGPAVNVDALGATVAVAVSGPAPALVLLDFSGGRARAVRRIPLEPGTRPAGVQLTDAHVAVAAQDRGVLVFGR